jgi:hypothetical protein
MSLHDEKQKFLKYGKNYFKNNINKCEELKKLFNNCEFLVSDVDDTDY